MEMESFHLKPVCCPDEKCRQRCVRGGTGGVESTAKTLGHNTACNVAAVLTE